MQANAVVDLGYGFSQEATAVAIGQCACLTKHHCKSNSFYSLTQQRKLRTHEYLRLQGIPDDRLVIPHGIQESHVREMCGNSFSIPVVGKILERILFSAGLIDNLIRCTGKGSAGHVWP